MHFEQIDRGAMQRDDSAEQDLGFDNSLIRGLEAILIVTSEPLTVHKASQVLNSSGKDIEKAFDELAKFYEDSARGFYLQKVAGGFRFASRPELSYVLERFAISQTSPRLSSAALETLAIVAYRQPISRGQIASIRGVNSDSVLKMLVARGYVEAVGKDSGPGNPVLFSTSDIFLEKLGLFSLSELPPIEGFMPGSDFAEALETSFFEDD